MILFVFLYFIFKARKISVLEGGAELFANQLTQKLPIKLMCKKNKLGFYKVSEACLPMMYYPLLAIQFYLLNCHILVLIDGLYSLILVVGPCSIFPNSIGLYFILYQADY